MSNPTEEQLAELVAYLPMFRRLASYENWAEASLPDKFNWLECTLEGAAEALDKLVNGPTAATESSVPPGLRRPSDEPLHPNAILVWRQVAWLTEEVQANPGHFTEVVARAKAAVGDPK